MNGKIKPPATLRALLQRGGARLLRHLLPGACALCGGDSDEALCPGCAAQFFGAAALRPRCPRCANPTSGSEPTFGHEPGATPGSGLSLRHELDAGSGSGPAFGHGSGSSGPLCGVCLADPPAYDRTLVATDYAMPVDQLVLQLKFAHRLALAPLMARLLRDAVLLQPDFTLPAVLCPVPLGPQRLAERGYNQALEIARPLARSMGVRLEARLISRVHDTAAQSSVAPEQRRHNIAGAFAIRDAALVAGRHIGIVDDVMTSGGTLNELASVLKRHGAARVSNLVFARTPPH
ncbi:ComF family protein [Duganella callida]|uniref:ComF family protein n=1 Tax=Duganella callida TaxID=2561932 RepID=A0A4Y9SP91_9BURK|nr:ComF family protein [Duganella callida]TFW25269.1 ComF family protein [Duganella callida]